MPHSRPADETDRPVGPSNAILALELGWLIDEVLAAHPSVLGLGELSDAEASRIQSDRLAVLMRALSFETDEITKIIGALGSRTPADEVQPQIIVALAAA